MIIYPAIDIRGGRCVRLTQGLASQQKVYADDPVAIAAEFQRAGAAWVHVVDLDGAFAGEPANLGAAAAISKLGLCVQFGGGLRSRASVERALETGISRVVIGTRAAETPEFVAGLIESYGKRIAVGIDAKNGQVAVRGWVDTTPITALELARRMDALGVATLIHTDIGTDGMLGGPNIAALESVLSTVRARVIASGGVSRREDVAELAQLSHRYSNLDGVIVGKALYERRVTLPDLLAAAASGEA